MLKLASRPWPPPPLSVISNSLEVSPYILRVWGSLTLGLPHWRLTYSYASYRLRGSLALELSLWGSLTHMGIDTIDPSYLQHKSLFNYCFVNGVCPSVWRKAVIFPISKSGISNKQISGNYIKLKWLTLHMQVTGQGPRPREGGREGRVSKPRLLVPSVIRRL